MKKPFHHHLYDYFLPHERNGYRPHLFSAVSIIAILIAIIFFEAAYLTQTKVVFRSTDFLASVLPSVLTDLTNKARAEEGIALVSRNTLLDVAAQAAAQDMADKGYFAHVSPDGKTPWYWLDRAGYAYSYAGQNLAINFTDSENVETAWLESPTHRANIMKPQYTQVGFGTANGTYEGKETTFVVEFLAAPAAAAAEKVAVVPASPTPQETAPVTEPTQVLGSEAPAQTPAAPALRWSARLLASPLTTLMTILTVLFSVIAISFSISIFLRGKVQHPGVVYGGAFLIVLIPAAMLASVLLTGPVLLPSGEGAASAYLALPN